MGTYKIEELTKRAKASNNYKKEHGLPKETYAMGISEFPGAVDWVQKEGDSEKKAYLKDIPTDLNYRGTTLTIRNIEVFDHAPIAVIYSNDEIAVAVWLFE